MRLLKILTRGRVAEIQDTFLLNASWIDPHLAPVLLTIIVLAAASTTVLFVISAIAYYRRRSIRYLLVMSVLGLLVTRSVIGFATALGLVPMAAHHLVEHGIDLATAVLILYAVYRTNPDTEQIP